MQCTMGMLVFAQNSKQLLDVLEGESMKRWFESHGDIAPNQLKKQYAVIPFPMIPGLKESIELFLGTQTIEEVKEEPKNQVAEKVYCAKEEATPDLESLKIE